MVRYNIKVFSIERGKGYAKAAMRLFLDDFFNNLGGCKLIDNVALENGSTALRLFQELKYPF